MIDIKGTSGNTLTSVSIDEGSKRKYTIMKEDYILLKFSLSSPIAFGLGSYIETEYGRFEICDEQKPSYNTNTGGYDYELRFDAHYWKWKNKIFKFTPEAGGQEASWSLTAALDVQLGVLLRNLKALGYSYNGVDYTFSIDSSVENKAILMSYDNTNLLDALFSMASKEKWNCDCWITDNVIHFGRCEFGDDVKIEQAVNADITRSESKGVYATRIYSFGSTKNIPQNYRPADENVVVNGIVQKRLMLPAGTPYIDAYRYAGGKRVYLGEAGYANGTTMPQEEAIEDVIVLEDVFPKMTGSMSDITTKEYTEKVENQDGTTTEKKWNAYRYKDTSLRFSKEYILPGQELQIFFQSGKLNGMVFAVTFNPEGEPEKLKDGNWNTAAQLWEIVRNDTYGRPLPDDTLKPSNGDKFVLTGFDTKLVGDTMIPEAEKKLKEETEKHVNRTMVDDGTFTATLYPSWVHEDQINRTFGIGQKIQLDAKEFFEEGRVSRVIGYEFNLDIPYDHPVYTIGESAAYSRIGELEDKIESLTYKGQTYEGGGGSGVYLIRTNDKTPPTDSNVFSALRALSMFLRKDQADQTSHLLKLLGGMEVGQYKEGVAGGKIDEQGAAELKNLLVREGIESTNFNAGALGTGFLLKTDPETGRSYLEVDELFARVGAVFVELGILKLVYAGGNWVFSAAGGKCAKVEELEDVYRCYLAVDNGKTAVENEFRVDDQVRCQEFNVKPGVHQNVSNRYYWRLVVGVGEDYIDLSKTDCDAGSVAPLKGDDLVQLGNRNDVKRQNAIVISAYGEGSPSITQHKGINSYSLAGTERTRISPDKNVFSGEFHFESGKNVETSINETGLQVTEVKSSVKALENKISLKVDSGTFNELKQQVQAQGSEIQVAKDAIKSKVSKTEVEGIASEKGEIETRRRMLVPDGTFGSGLVPYLYTGITAVSKGNAPSGCPSSHCGCTSSRDGYGLYSILVASGEKIHIEATVNTTQTSNTCAVGILFKNENLETITWSPAFNVDGGSGWVRKGGVVTAPSAAKYMLIWFQIDARSNFGKFYFTEVVASSSMGALSYSQGLSSRIEKNETSITQLDNKISLKAEKSVVDNLGSRLSAAEVAIQPDNIWLKVSSKVNQVAVDASKKTHAIIDATGLDPNTYFPVTIKLYTWIPQYRIKVSRTLGEWYGVPWWSSHAGGFSLLVEWVTNASGWGTIDVQRIINTGTYYHANVYPVGNISQLSHSSREYIYVRGGSKYDFNVDGDTNVAIELHPNGLVVDGENINPVSEVSFSWREQPTKDEIKAGIGVTTGGVTVFGKTISLNGVVTFSSLASDAQGKINTAQNTANTAVSKADTAQSTADTARTELIERARLGKTLIDGGKIKTDLIDVNWIFARDITANSFHLKAGKIGAFTVDSRGLSNSDYSSYINIGNNTTRFVRINYDVDTLLAVRAQNESKRGVSISSDGAGCTALSITAQNGSIAIHSSGGHEFYQRKGEKWNTPGVLWAAKLRSDGSIENQWGNGLGDVNVSTGKHTVGHFYITHNLGRWDYFPIVTSELGNNNTRTSACVKNITTSGFEVQVTDMGDRYTDASIFVCIIGRNKW